MRLLLLGGVLGLAACSEDLDTRENCPALCPNQALSVRDTTFDAILYDSAFGGFTNEGSRWPSPAIPAGLGSDIYATYVPLGFRPDSLDVRQVFRFDSLPRTVSVADTNPITEVRTPELRLRLSRALSTMPRAGFTVELYDVDSTGSALDTVPAVLTSLFRADRRIATLSFDSTFVADSSDSLRLALPPAVVLAKARSGGRLRIGVRVVGPRSTSLQLVAARVPVLPLVPRVTFFVNADTVLRTLSPRGSIDGTPQALLASQTLVVSARGEPLNDGSMEVGGLVGSRTLLRLSLPRRFLDTVQVVRVTLDLVQRPRRDVAGAGDSVALRPRLVVAGDSVRSARQRTELLDPTLEALRLRALRMAPRDSGVRSFDLASALTIWSDTLRPTELVLYSEGEGSREQRFAFYSGRNPNAALRPRVRITYVPRQRVLLP